MTAAYSNISYETVISVTADVLAEELSRSELQDPNFTFLAKLQKLEFPNLDEKHYIKKGIRVRGEIVWKPFNRIDRHSPDSLIKQIPKV